MNLLFITTTFPTPIRPRQGSFNASLVSALRKNHRVDVIAPIPWTQRFGLQRTIDGSTDSEFPFLYPTYWYPPKFFRRDYHRFYWSSIRPSVQRVGRDHSVDAVVGYWLHPDGTAAVTAARSLDVPVVLISGGSDLKCLVQSAPRRQQILAAIDQSDRLIVVSHDLRNTAIELGVRDERISVCYRGVDRHLFHPGEMSQSREKLGIPAEQIVLLWVGRLEPVKNPQLLIDLALRLKQRWGSRLHLAIVGEGSQRRSMQHAIDRNGLQSHVRLKGALDQADLATWYQSSDCVLLTSDSEGIPNVLLEAIACERPFVSTDVGGIGEVMTPGIDRLVPAGDLDAFEKAVVQCFESKTTNPRRFQPPSPEHFAHQVEGIIADSIKVRIRETQRGLRPAVKPPHPLGEAVA